MKNISGRLALLACTIASLLACGGGGGGADNGPGGSGTPGSNTGGDGSVTATSDKSDLVFAAFDGQSVASQSIRFTLKDGRGTYYADMRSEPSDRFSMDFWPTTDTSAQVTVRAGPFPPGQHTGRLTFRLCHDTQCGKVAWWQTTPYKVSVFTLGRRELALSGVEGTASAPVSLGLVPADNTGLLVATAHTNDGGQWLSVARTAAGDWQVQADARRLAKGSYQGQVRLAFASADATPAQVIPVAFTVGEGLMAPPAQSIAWTATSTPQSLTGRLEVRFSGDQAPAWTARSNQPWLILDTAAGTGPGAIGYAVDTRQLASSPNWTSAVAQVTVSAAGVSDAATSVAVHKQLPEIYAVSPSTVPALRASTVRITGRGLSQLQGIAAIHLDGQASTAGSVASDTEAVLELPALAAGTHQLAVPNTAATATSVVGLAAASPAALGHVTVANAGSKRSAVFDAGRNAVFAVNRDTNMLVRMRLDGSQQTVDGVPVGEIGDLALGPDRQTLYVSSGASRLLAIDPDSLQTKATHAIPSEQAYAYDGALKPSLQTSTGLAITSDRRLWFAPSGWSPLVYFDMLGMRFGQVGVSPSQPLIHSPGLYAAADGSRLLAAEMGSYPANHYLYTTATGKLTPMTSLPNVLNFASLSADGSGALVNRGALYHGDGATGYQLKGRLPASPGVLNSVLSPDGRRIYALVNADDASRPQPEAIDVYDATQPDPQSAVLTRIGRIALTDMASDCRSSDYACDPAGHLLISPLGDTLLWLGNKQLVVIPVPTFMRPAALPRARLQKAAVQR